MKASYFRGRKRVGFLEKHQFLMLNSLLANGIFAALWLTVKLRIFAAPPAYSESLHQLLLIQAYRLSNGRQGMCAHKAEKLLLAKKAHICAAARSACLLRLKHRLAA